MKRNIEQPLIKWKNEFPRKALLVRGARQVGKTYSIRKLGKSFTHYLEVNFEEEKEIKTFFSGSLNPSLICQKLSAYFSIPIIPGQTLLFFDEIQACPEAISSLRFFYEKLPKLHVAAAGSLLEFVLSEIPSQGVGRIQSLFMHSMSFDEFLQAIGEKGLIEQKNNAGPKSPIDNVFHHKLIDYLKIYYLIGGMPESIHEYLRKKDILSCQTILGNILETLIDDFAKYKKRSPVQRLREVFNSIALQAGSKFKYSNIESASSHQPLKESLDLIVQAGLAYKIYHTSARGLPLGAELKMNKFKTILYDPGIQQKILGLNLAEIIHTNSLDLINKGHMAEIFTGLEIIKNSSFANRPHLYYWHKEKRGSNAEVDYIVQLGKEIVPIEVKSGMQGKMQSMHIFLKEHKLKRGIRISLENFSSFGNINVYPLYAIGNIFKKIKSP